ncbi:MAG: ABC transporter permease [Chloroflexota bacterium]
MRNAWLVAQRELGAIFVQPIAYVFIIMILLITGYIFAAQIAFYVLQFGGGPPPSVANVLGLFTFLAIFAAPAVTMRLLSEEQRSGTMELLMTLPIRDGEVVFGKWLAAFIFYLASVALTIIYPVILIRFGNPDVGPIFSGYLGTILWGAGLLGVGVLASAVSENQIVSFMLAFGLNLALYLAALAGQSFTSNPTITNVLNQFSYEAHLGGFLDGVMTATDVVYYILVTAVALFAATRILETRRWR